MDYKFSGSQKLKLFHIVKFSILNCGFGTIILSFIFIRTEQHLMQYAHMKNIRVCFQLKIAFIWWKKLCLCVYVVVGK